MWSHRIVFDVSRKSSLVFVCFHTLLTLFFFFLQPAFLSSASAPPPPSSPPRRVRWYSLECHFCLNLRRWSKQSKHQTCPDSLPLVQPSPANNNNNHSHNHNKYRHDPTKICTGNLSFQALPNVTYTTEKTTTTSSIIQSEFCRRCISHLSVADEQMTNDYCWSM